MSNGAPMLSWSYDGREFQCTGDGTSQPEQGGYDSEFQSNGNPATGRYIMTPVGWSMPEFGFEINVDQNDWEYLNDKKNSGTDGDIVFTYVDAIYTGRGRIVGKMPWDPTTASGRVALMGAGELKKQ